jgi:Raf kinase inhibitor-like YbhB/YbcL family protein
MKLSSPEFENDGFIPEKFTCDGDDINPVLVIQDIPPETKSLALIVDDPDAAKGSFIHWVVYNMPVTTRIEKNSAPGTPGKNDFGQTGYGGPCPHRGLHHYHFKLYALDTELDLKPNAKAQDVEYAMVRHILDSAVLIGTYQNREERKLAASR